MIIQVKPGRDKKPVYIYEQEKRKESGIGKAIRQVIDGFLWLMGKIIIVAGTIAILQFSSIILKILSSSY